MNNLLKHYEEIPFEKGAYSIEEYTKSYCWYNTNYDLIDSEGKLLIEDRRTTCFKMIFLEDYAGYSLLDFNKNLKLRIYALSEDTILTEEEIREYLDNIKDLQIPFEFHILEDYDLNSRIIQKYFFKRQRVYMIEVPLNNINLLKLKFIAYHFRYIYEMYGDLSIRESLRYKNKFPQYSIIQILPYIRCRLRYSEGKTCGHSILSCCGHYDNITIDRILKCLEHDDQLEDFERNFDKYLRFVNYDWGPVVSMETAEHISDDISIDDYMEKFKSLENVKKS